MNVENGFHTMRDFHIHGKKILVRCDFNSPIGPKGEVLEFMRIKVYKPTFDMLRFADKVVVMSHQGRKGRDDCVSLKNHAKILDQTIEQEVIFVDDTIGKKAMKAIDDLKQGQVLVLENTRFLDEEEVNALPEEHAESELVKKLAPKFDLFINDAFSVCHRSQPSVVGFPMVLPSCVGQVVEKEMEAMHYAIQKGRRPSIYLIGGNKFTEVIRVMEAMLKSNRISKVLLGGGAAQVFLYIRGMGSKKGLSVVSEKGTKLEELLERARRLDARFRERIETPIDLAISYGGRHEVQVTSPMLEEYDIMDIGEKTIQVYSYEIRRARAVMSKGPMGKYEDPPFLKGTVKLLNAMEDAPRAYTLIGGGHMGNIAFDLGTGVDHISTAGGAVLAFMSGDQLPGINVLVESAKKFGAEKKGALNIDEDED